MRHDLRVSFLADVMGKEKMETTIMGYIGITGHILGLYFDNGKQNGNYYLGFKGWATGDVGFRETLGDKIHRILQRILRSTAAFSC